MSSFSQGHFTQLSSFVRQYSGISYSIEKKDMLGAKAGKIMQKYGFASWDEFLRNIASGGKSVLLQDLMNELAVNKTDFFREDSHFKFIAGNRNLILEKNSSIRSMGQIRAWSTACSTGEEVYTLAMVLKEVFPEIGSIKLLGTDISTKALKVAQRGVYSSNSLGDVPDYYVSKYFQKVESDRVISDDIRDMTVFRLFNLSSPFSFKNKFDIIFCRNVMIYFDVDFQKELLRKLYNVLNHGGLLFLGHSESMVNKELNFKFVIPAVYMKV